VAYKSGRSPETCVSISHSQAQTNSRLAERLKLKRAECIECHSLHLYIDGDYWWFWAQHAELLPAILHPQCSNRTLAIVETPIRDRSVTPHIQAHVQDRRRVYICRYLFIPSVPPTFNKHFIVDISIRAWHNSHTLTNMGPLSDSQFSLIIAFIGIYVLYIGARATYSVYFGPLAKFPGPKLAAATLWYEFYYDVILRGQYTFKIKELHNQYGALGMILMRWS
jgi:hypothetical protein